MQYVYKTTGNLTKILHLYRNSLKSWLELCIANTSTSYHGLELLLSNLVLPVVNKSRNCPLTDFLWMNKICLISIQNLLHISQYKSFIEIVESCLRSVLYTMVRDTYTQFGFFRPMTKYLHTALSASNQNRQMLTDTWFKKLVISSRVSDYL